jgi:hypothetical protein
MELEQQRQMQRQPQPQTPMTLRTASANPLLPLLHLQSHHPLALLPSNSIVLEVCSIIPLNFREVVLLDTVGGYFTVLID